MPASIALDIAQTYAFFAALFLLFGCEFLMLWLIGRRLEAGAGWAWGIGLVGGVLAVPMMPLLWNRGLLRAPLATNGSLLILSLASLAGLVTWHWLRSRGETRRGMYAIAALLVLGCSYAAFRWSAYDVEQQMLADHRAQHGDRARPALH